MKLVIALPFVFLLTGCASMPGPTTDTGCLWVRPIYVAEQDKLTTETAGEILAHNEKWKANCK